MREPSAKAHDEYAQWCEENGETPLGLTNFNSIIAAETGLVRRNVLLKRGIDKDAFEWWQSRTTVERALSEDKAYVKCWTAR